MTFDFECMLDQAMTGQPVYRDSDEAVDHDGLRVFKSDAPWF